MAVGVQRVLKLRLQLQGTVGFKRQNKPHYTANKLHSLHTVQIGGDISIIMATDRTMKMFNSIPHPTPHNHKFKALPNKAQNISNIDDQQELSGNSPQKVNLDTRRTLQERFHDNTQ